MDPQDQQQNDQQDQATIAWVTAASKGTLPERMGIEFLEVTSERVVGRMPVAGNTQPYGLLHGGASAVLAETLGSVSAAMVAGTDKAVVGLDINATHHRGARDGYVVGTAVPLSGGKTVVAVEITIVEEATGKRVCTSRLTCLVRDRPPAQPA